MSKEQHPYLHHFDTSESWKYLIVGTIPPNNSKECKREFAVDYFYGNVGSLWDILQPLYSEYDFKKKEQIIKWQKKYSIGITDTVLQCNRLDKCSPLDYDLNLKSEDYNYALKDYVLKNKSILKRIFFTSCSGKFNAFSNFKKIMGDKFSSIDGSILVKLPSPSGSANTSLFRGKADKFGLVEEFYNFLIEAYPDTVKFAEQTFIAKKLLPKGTKVRRLPEDRKYTLEFKQWFYKKQFPLKDNA